MFFISSFYSWMRLLTQKLKRQVDTGVHLLNGDGGDPTINAERDESISPLITKGVACSLATWQEKNNCQIKISTVDPEKEVRS